MKKLLVISFSLLFALGLHAQKFSGTTIEQSFANESRAINPLPKGLIFYEGFDNVSVPNLPAGWSTFSAGDQGFASVTAGTKIGQTNENGFWPVPHHGFFAATNDDVCNCDKSIDLLTSKAFNLSTQDFVRIGFSAYQNGSGSQTAELQIKDHGTGWMTIFTIPGSANWETYSIIVPTSFYDQGFQFRFRYNDHGNFASGLAIDDVFLANKAADDFRLSEFYSIKGNISASGYLGHSMPRSQAQHAHLEFSALVENGTLKQKNARLKVEVNGPVSFSDTTASFDFASGDEKLVHFRKNLTYTPYDSGTYTLTSTLLTDSIDSNILDNSFSSTFMVSDSIYSRTDGTSDGTGIWMVDEASRMGSVYQIFKSDTVQAIWIGIHPTTTVGARFKVKIFDFNTLTSSIYSSSPVAISSTDIGKSIRVELNKVLDPGKYLFILESETNVSNRLVISSTSKKKSPHGISYYQNPGQQWIHLAYFPNLSLVFPVVDENCPGHIQATVKNESCQGTSDGQIEVEAIDVNFLATYSWSNGAGNIDHIDNLEAGSYQVIVTDGNNCIYSRVFNLEIAQQIAVNPIIALDSCGTQKGAILLNASGGQEPLRTFLNGNAFVNKITHLSQGQYPINIVDDNGCDFDTTISLLGSSPLNIAVGIQPSSCAANNGKLSATAIGTPPFKYLWNTGDSVNNIQALESGIYELTVSDSINCSSSVKVFLNDSNAPVLNLLNTSDVECYGSETGSLEIGASGINSPFSFEWSNADTSYQLVDVNSGEYELTVTDSLGCKSFGSYSIQELGEPFFIDFIEQGIACHNNPTGSIKCLVNGGSKPYSFAWTPSVSTSNNITNLSEGDYALTITDNEGCTLSFSTKVYSQPPFFMTVDSIFGDTDGVSSLDASIYLSVFGGTPPYNYAWSNGNRFQDLVNVDTGFYSVHITDQFGCSLNYEKYLSNNPLGVDQLSSPELTSTKFFPNPGSIFNHFHLISDFEIRQIVVRDLLGRHAKYTCEINGKSGQLNFFSAGVHIVTVEFENGYRESLRLIVF